MKNHRVIIIGSEEYTQRFPMLIWLIIHSGSPKLKAIAHLRLNSYKPRQKRSFALLWWVPICTHFIIMYKNSYWNPAGNQASGFSPRITRAGSLLEHRGGDSQSDHWQSGTRPRHRQIAVLQWLAPCCPFRARSRQNRLGQKCRDSASDRRPDQSEPLGSQ
jgi:hypothetical protein